MKEGFRGGFLASRLDFNASIALKHQGLMSFGTASWIQDETLGFTADAELDVGEQAEIRLELTGLPDTVLADIVVVKARPDPRSEAFRYAARIQGMTPGDRDLLDQWVEERSQGSTSFTAERMLASLTASAVENRARRAGAVTGERTTPRPSGSPRSSQTWTPSSSVSQNHERGRARINQALRQRLDAPAPTETSTAPAAPRPPRTRDGDSDDRSVASTFSTSSVYSTTSVADKESAFDPQVSWAEGDQRATVTWQDPHNLIHDWKTYLCNKALPLPMEHPHPKRGTRLALRLVLPDGQSVTIRSRVSGRSGRTVLFSVELSPGVRHKLRQATRAAALADRD